VGNEAIKEIGAACQVSSSRPLQAIGAFPKKKFFSRMVGRHFANRGPFQRVMLHRTCHLVQACCISKRYLSSSPSVASMIRKNCKLSADNGARNSNDPIWLTPSKRPSGFATSSANLQITPVASSPFSVKTEDTGTLAARMSSGPCLTRRHCDSSG
jgi:hypothetical protein